MYLFVHASLGEEVRFISGGYRLLAEEEMIHRGRRLIYLVGIAEVDSSCCGHRGGRFVSVAGYACSQKKKDEGGRWVTEVEEILESCLQKEIEGILIRTYPHSQIVFGN